ncbi:hypothetical protein SASPL_149530 [Salvia splendens]|uniref:Uncharacterized protein n=1 Tax=Salvia splendens TaxID=180675 RepID=A0A8X8WAZ6_SALSN|nr:hypothetical protein SASPL_149530 [Salvia splendens]
MNPNSTTAGNRRKAKKSTPFPSTRWLRSTSPSRRVCPPPFASAIGDGGLFVEELSQFEALRISPESPNPRSSPHNVKQQCWEKAEKIKGRDPDRWRRDSLGNTVFRKLAGCPGCLCHDYDHIVPYSKICYAGWKKHLRKLPSFAGKFLLITPNIAYLENEHIVTNQQLSTDPRETGLRSPKTSLFREVPLAGSKVAKWTFLSCRPMVMFVVAKIPGDVRFNDEIRMLLRNFSYRWGN